jgi:RES domain-containing protein
MTAALPDPAPPYPAPQIRHQGLLYRALNPLWMRMPLSGEGARRHGGRFNPRGMEALYTALSPMGAVAEANQIGRPFEPVTLVAYEADISPIFDATDPAALAARAIAPALLLADDWRLRMTDAGGAPSQRLGQDLAAAGYAGMRVASFARGAAPGSANLVLWRWGAGRPALLRLIDSENRLQ